MLARRQSFLRNFLVDPRAIGALAPATQSLAASVAEAAHEAVDRHAREPLQLIELGAGTGALTRRIQGLQPVLIEQNEEWARLLREHFPALEVRHECATRTLRALERPVGLVTSIPLLNNPQSGELKELLAEKYAEGLIRFCVLYTYGWSDPLAGSAFRSARRAGFVPRSLPPAHVWVYE